MYPSQTIRTPSDLRVPVSDTSRVRKAATQIRDAFLQAIEKVQDMTDVPEVPDTPIMRRTVFQSLTIKDAIFACMLLVMGLQLHFNDEARIQALEEKQTESAQALDLLRSTIKDGMVPRKEVDSTNQGLDRRLTNIETSLQNIESYMLNHH